MLKSRAKNARKPRGGFFVKIIGKKNGQKNAQKPRKIGTFQGFYNP